ncbi:MAG: hypothetical protein M9945_12630 [Aquamicrobium sp.]|uniref:hypothetical protein n=1 Tax=Aquamicrobium sp. TaxID=1872579 RepID=UPI00349EC926|nr:hypothetical protein [Aquamicrobium sp.]
MTMPAISYSQACRDPNLFGEWFAGDSWATWRVIDKAMFGEPLDDAELAIFTELTGRDAAPTQQAREVWIIAGRRSGKDIKTASVAAYLATIAAGPLGFLRRLKPGERGVVQVLAVDRDQAKVCMGYLLAFFELPLLKQMVKSSSADSVELTNGLAVEITTNDQRRVRGRTVVAVIFDEVAHWRGDDAANPDEAVYQAVKPAMATMLPGAMLIGISSPHARSGLLYRKYRDSYGKDGNTLVIKAPTWVMNPTVPRDSEIIGEAFDADPAWASAEYGAEFRTDIEAFLSREVIEACVDQGVRERLPDRNKRYIGFVDPSGGSSDSMTLAVAHIEGKTVVLDCIREITPPFSPQAAVIEFVATLRDYQLSMVFGDNYGAQWVQEAFRKIGCAYELAGRAKSALYLDFLPIANSGAVALLDHKKMVNQFTALERRSQRGSRDSVDHPRGGHDDIANAVAGAVAIAARNTTSFAEFMSRKQQEIPPGCWLMPPLPDARERRGRIEIG